MPIDYKNYPANWKTEIRPEILKRSNNCCEFCGVENYSQGIRDNDGNLILVETVMDKLENEGVDLFDTILSKGLTKSGEAKVIKIVLTVAHLDHNIKNNEFTNLKALCQKCHLNYDKLHHMKNSKITLNKKKGLQELFTN
jgi:glyoxylase-like metal-dependent hydrolase (beta-lactamase superfamily II)